MKKFGFGKKGDDGDDASRNALFGSRKKGSTASAPADNPYAQQSAQAAADPYADSAKYANVTPYRQAVSQLGGPTQSGASAGGQQDSSGRAGGYGGYSSDKFGSGAGYGSNRYDSSTGPNRYGASAAGTRGPGGYGGFGRTDTDEQDSNRDALFSGAQERYSQKQQTFGATSGYNQGSAPTASQDTYEGYGDQRELTEEEQEAAEYQAILAEKRQVQQESASSVSRSVQMARQANEVGRATLARLGAQGERLHNTEKNLDLAANQNKIAQDRAAELKTLNRSMFAVHVSNPFTSKQRLQKADEEVLNRHRAERDQREATRREGFNATQRMESNFRDINTAGRAKQQRTKKDYGKFNLEDEEGADELEDQIDDGITELEGQVSMMNMVSRAIGKEIDSQNNQIDRIMTKSDAVDDATRMNRERLARIK